MHITSFTKGIIPIFQGVLHFLHQIIFNVLLPLWSTVLSLSTPILAEYYILYLHFMLHTSFCSSSLFFIIIITKAAGTTRRISIYLSLRRKLGSCSTTLLFGFLQQQKTSPAAFANGEVRLKYYSSDLLMSCHKTIAYSIIR